MKKWSNVYKNNRVIVWAAIVSLILVAIVLLTVHDEVTRFTLIMPIFAGFILFSILMTADEELDDDLLLEKPKKQKSKKK